MAAETLDDIARHSIAFETKKSATMAFAAGLPGGFALVGTVPADVAQYYIHAFRVMQKLAYLYGWQSFLSVPAAFGRGKGGDASLRIGLRSTLPPTGGSRNRSGCGEARSVDAWVRKVHPRPWSLVETRDRVGRRVSEGDRWGGGKRPIRLWRAHSPRARRLRS